MAPAMKFKGGNMLLKKITNTHPKDLIKTFKLFVGDTVQVTGGKRDVGKIGTIMEIIKRRNLIVVKDVAMQVKHMKPNPFYPKGDRILKETPIHYSNVQLLDPSIQKGVKVDLSYQFNPEKGKHEVIRISKETQTVIPAPEKEDPFKDREESPLNTKAEIVQQVTWTPNIFKNPFPNSLMNELERMARRGRASQAI